MRPISTKTRSSESSPSRKSSRGTVASNRPSRSSRQSVTQRPDSANTVTLVNTDVVPSVFFENPPEHLGFPGRKRFKKILEEPVQSARSRKNQKGIDGITAEESSLESTEVPLSSVREEQHSIPRVMEESATIWDARRRAYIAARLLLPPLLEKLDIERVSLLRRFGQDVFQRKLHLPLKLSHLFSQRWGSLATSDESIEPRAFQTDESALDWRTRFAKQLEKERERDKRHLSAQLQSAPPSGDTAAVTAANVNVTIGAPIESMRRESLLSSSASSGDAADLSPSPNRSRSTSRDPDAGSSKHSQHPTSTKQQKKKKEKVREKERKEKEKEKSRRNRKVSVILPTETNSSPERQNTASAATSAKSKSEKPPKSSRRRQRTSSESSTGAADAAAGGAIGSARSSIDMGDASASAPSRMRANPKSAAHKSVAFMPDIAENASDRSSPAAGINPISTRNKLRFVMSSRESQERGWCLRDPIDRQSAQIAVLEWCIQRLRVARQQNAASTTTASPDRITANLIVFWDDAPQLVARVLQLHIPRFVNAHMPGIERESSSSFSPPAAKRTLTAALSQAELIPIVPQPFSELRTPLITRLESQTTALFYNSRKPAVLIVPSVSGGSYTLVWGTDGALLALFTPTGHGFCSCERPTAAAAAGSSASTSSPSLFSAHERSRARFVANAGGCALYRADGSLAQRVRWAPPPQRLPGTILLPLNEYITFRCDARFETEIRVELPGIPGTRFSVAPTPGTSVPATTEQLGTLKSGIRFLSQSSKKHRDERDDMRHQPRGRRANKKAPDVNWMAEEDSRVAQFELQFVDYLKGARSRIRRVAARWQASVRELFHLLTASRLSPSPSPGRSPSSGDKPSVRFAESAPYGRRALHSSRLEHRNAISARTTTALSESPAVDSDNEQLSGLSVHLQRARTLPSYLYEARQFNTAGIERLVSRDRCGLVYVPCPVLLRAQLLCLLELLRDSAASGGAGGVHSDGEGGRVDADAVGETSPRAPSDAECAARLRALVRAGVDSGGFSCRCSRFELPEVRDLELDLFLTRAVPRTQLILILVHDSAGERTPAQKLLEYLFARENHVRTRPCLESEELPFRMLAYDVRRATLNSSSSAHASQRGSLDSSPAEFSTLPPPLVEPLLVRRHRIAPGMCLIYRGGELLFCDHTFNGYGVTRKNLIVQLESCRERAERGDFLPRDFKFDPHESQCCAPSGGAEWSLSNSARVGSESSLSYSRPTRRTNAGTPRATAILHHRQTPLSAPTARPLGASAQINKLNPPKIVVQQDDSVKLPAILKEHTL